MKTFIGIDDTDNLETRGTGHQARTLGLSLAEAGLFRLETVTRHQLLVDRAIPFTSHNSSACLAGEMMAAPALIAEHCREFLIRESAFDADAGLCIATEDQTGIRIKEFGDRAKKEILTMEEAISLAAGHGIYLDGFLNTRLGMIGSLAAVGLRSRGNDGRLLWTRNLRETTGIFRIGEYLALTGIDRAITPGGSTVPGNARVNITGWCRPVMKDGQVTLFVEETEIINLYEYESASKEFIKGISE